eukprot:CAMPEP_0198276912 /NCGR_PEP_ID=MMETSP1447-20131203/65566_1 /TAXON_ID=420782 /ORGANISM="Chaetoceros dichaeta, Strain CCMP1751" /LENGTH=528 /DNA_ID=CAMNT_0043971895 /DNA_START=71 /DNA_END=1657 /DNA_ORIENTATION=-
MGASSTGSSPFSSDLSSLNDEKVTRFATNASTSLLSTVHSFQQQNSTTIVEHAQQNDDVKTRKRSIPLDSSGIDFSGRKKRRYENTNCPQMNPTNSPFLNGARKPAQDFAHEFVDSDTSLSSCEEEAECAAEVTGMHETIDRNSHIFNTPKLPKIGYSSATTSITLGQTPINPVVIQVVSSSKALSPPTAIASKRGRGGGMKQSASDQATGRWTRQEHEAFLVGLKEYGREWKKVAYKIPTRTSAQIRSHAQKYFAKITRDEQQHAAALAASSQLTGLSPIPGDDTGIDHAVCRSNDHPPDNLSASMLERFNEILKDPETVQRQVEETLCRLRNRYSELQRTIEQKQRRAVEQRGGSNKQNNTATTTTTTTTTNISYQPAPVGSIIHPTSNHHRSSPVSSRPMTIPLELQQQQQQKNVIETSKEHRVVKSEADVRRYIDSSEGSLARRELIALHVLGDTLHRSTTQENTLQSTMGRGVLPTCNATTQITGTGTRTSLGLNETHSSGQQENDSITSVHVTNMNSSNHSN